MSKKETPKPGNGVRVRSGVWCWRFNLQGKEYAGTTDLAGVEQNRTKAETIVRNKRSELLGIAVEARKPKSFAAGAAEFLYWCETVEYRGKLSTARRIKTSFASALVFFGDRAIADIAGADIEQYKVWRIDHHGVRDVTLRHDLHALSIFWQRYALKHAWTRSNPIAEVSMPSDRDSMVMRPVTPAEEGKYFARAATVRDAKKRRNLYDVARLMLNQGCRPEEIVSLRKQDVNLAARQITIAGGKTRAARRTLDLTAESVKILAGRLKLFGMWLFPSCRYPGRHITKLSGAHDRVCIEAGLSGIRLYDFRHTFASRLADDGTPIPTIAALLGHAGLTMVTRYVHPSADAKRDAMKKYDAAMNRRKLKVVGR